MKNGRILLMPTSVVWKGGQHPWLGIVNIELFFLRAKQTANLWEQSGATCAAAYQKLHALRWLSNRFLNK